METRQTQCGMRYRSQITTRGITTKSPFFDNVHDVKLWRAAAKACVKAESSRRTVSNATGKPCTLYFMQCKRLDMIKIGIANDVVKRRNSLQSGNPQHIEVYKTVVFKTRGLARSYERDLHRRFSDKRMRGEWFKITTCDVDKIANLLTGDNA